MFSYLSITLFVSFIILILTACHIHALFYEVYFVFNLARYISLIVCWALMIYFLPRKTFVKFKKETLISRPIVWLMNLLRFNCLLLQHSGLCFNYQEALHIDWLYNEKSTIIANGGWSKIGFINLLFGFNSEYIFIFKK